MHYYASEKAVSIVMSVSVSTSRSGLPRIIPPYHRRIIRERSDRSDALVKLYLSLFTIAKLIKLAKSISRDTFTSMISGPTDMEGSIHSIKSLMNMVPILVRRYVPTIEAIPLHQGMSWSPTWKALPSDPFSMDEVGSILKKRFRSIFSGLPFEWSAWYQKVTKGHPPLRRTLPGVLWWDRIRYAFDGNNEFFSEHDLDRFHEVFIPHDPFPEYKE